MPVSQMCLMCPNSSLVGSQSTPDTSVTLLMHLSLGAGKPGNASKIVMHQSFEPDSGAKPQRHRLTLPLDVHPGDTVDFVTLARENHDCDGVYLIDVQVLPMRSLVWP